MNEKIYFSSPIGTLEIQGNNNGVECISFTEEESTISSPENIKNPELKRCYSQLKEYFEGERKEFDLKLCPEGTDFQNKVWKLLQQIPFGRTMSYNKLAHIYGNPKSIRAIANANSKNKIAIIIPCHRVIGSDSSLTGYAGGLHRKKWLLEFETSYGNQMNIFNKTNDI